MSSTVILTTLLGNLVDFCLNPVYAQLPCNAQPQILLIHGFQGEEQDFTTEIGILRKIYPQAGDEIFVWRWTAPPIEISQIWKRPIKRLQEQWKNAVENHLKAVEDLFHEIEAMSPEEQRRLVLVGHSLGGSVVIHTLAKCQNKGIKIDHFVLAGAAIANDDPDIELALKTTTNRSYSLVNMQDYALKLLYRPAENVPALGTGSTTMWDKTQFCEMAFHMELSHSSALYLAKFQNCVIVNKYQSEVLLVPQDEPNISRKTLCSTFGDIGDMLGDALAWTQTQLGMTWTNVDEQNGWVLQKSDEQTSDEQKNDEQKRDEQKGDVPSCYRILSPAQECMAWGEQARMTASFAKVKVQLTDGSDYWVPSTAQSTDTENPQSQPEDAKTGRSLSKIARSLSIFSWETLNSWKGWKLRRNRWSTQLQILDPDGQVQQAGYDEETMRGEFEKVVKTLESR